MKDRYVYPAYFCYDLPGQVGVVFPDLPGCVSQGDNDEDVLRMAREGLSLHLWGMEKDRDDIPEATPIRDLRPEPDQVVVLIDVFMPPFREHMSEKAVTKNVTLPRWLELEAKAAGLNYSRVLQDGLMARLGIEREINHRPGRKKDSHSGTDTIQYVWNPVKKDVPEGTSCINLVDCEGLEPTTR